MDDQSALVARMKDQVLSEGIDITTPCGGFEIVKRVAWELRNQGAGLLAKMNGSHPDGSNESPYGCWVHDVLYAYDIVIFPTGEHYDCLSGYNAQTKTGLDPIWHRVNKEGSEEPYLRPESYRPAIEPHPKVEPTPEPQPTPEPVPNPTPQPQSGDIVQALYSIRDAIASGALVRIEPGERMLTSKDLAGFETDFTKQLKAEVAKMITAATKKKPAK